MVCSECVESVPASLDRTCVCDTGSIRTQLLWNGTFCGDEFIELFERSGIYNGTEYYKEVPLIRYESEGSMYIFRKEDDRGILWQMSLAGHLHGASKVGMTLACVSMIGLSGALTLLITPCMTLYNV